MTVSLWQRRGGGSITQADVIIIGGGIVGLSAALEAEAHGLKPLLLERHTIGSGASGRNAGYLMRGMADTYAVAARHFGRENAKAVWKLSEDNLAALRELGVAETPGYHARPSCLVALNEQDEADLRESHAMLLEDGFESQLLEPADIPEPLRSRAAPKAALLNPSDAVCDPIEVLAMLRSRLKTTTIVESCEVFDITTHEGTTFARANVVDARANHTIVCTNAWAPELIAGCEGAIYHRRAQMLGAVPKNTRIDLPFSYYLNRGDEYLRSGPDGLLLMGGARRFEPAEQIASQSGVAMQVQSVLEDFVRKLAVDSFDVVARWSGVMGVTPDDLPLAGPVRSMPGVWVCAGFSGHGMSLGHLTAANTIKAMLGLGPPVPMFNPDRFSNPDTD